MIAFIDDHREVYGVEPICKVLPIAPSTYHAQIAQRIDPCPYRKSNPDVLMVQTSEVWGGHDTANGLHSTRRWCILVQR